MLDSLNRKADFDAVAGSAGRELFAAAAAALLVVLVLRLLTNTTPPIFDTRYYCDMAEHGIAGNGNLAAPFAYRPAVPLLVGGVDRVFHLAPPDGFAAAAAASAFLLLFLTYLFVRSVGGEFTPALCAMAAVGLSFYQVKFPLFFTTMIDIEASVVMLLALWALLKEQFLLCLLLSAAGVFVKEWLLIPAALMMIVLARQYYLTRARSSLLYALLTVAVVGGCFLLPRIAIPIPEMKDFQEYHKAPAEIRWSANFRMLFDGLKWVNILFALFSFWMPTALLMTKERTRYMWVKLKNIRGLLYAYLCMVLLFSLYGGTNIPIFVTYTFVAQILVIATFIEYGVSGWELLLTFGAMVLFNRLFAHIPLFTADFYGNVELYGGWSTLVTWKTLYRLLELSGYVAAMLVVRKVLGYYRAGQEYGSPAEAQGGTSVIHT